MYGLLGPREVAAESVREVHTVQKLTSGSRLLKPSLREGLVHSLPLNDFLLIKSCFATGLTRCSVTNMTPFHQFIHLHVRISKASL